MEGQMIDIGVNLLSKQFDTDRELLIERAAAAGVLPLIITGANERESKRAADFAQKFPGMLYSTAGVHPHDAKGCKENTITVLKLLLQKPQVVAVGECGLDYDRDFSPRDVQRKWFIEQIKLAEETGKPLFLHERAAFHDFQAILQEHKNVLPRAVVHCFTGSGKELTTYLSMGMMIGITGWICDEQRGAKLRQIVRLIPLNRLMIETDAPYLIPGNIPNGKKNRRNEPAFLPWVVKELAKCMGKKEEAIKKAATENAKTFFHLD